jgi:hypothetical protein
MVEKNQLEKNQLEQVNSYIPNYTKDINSKSMLLV